MKDEIFSDEGNFIAVAEASKRSSYSKCGLVLTNNLSRDVWCMLGTVCMLCMHCMYIHTYSSYTYSTYTYSTYTYSTYTYSTYTYSTYTYSVYLQCLYIPYLHVHAYIT